MKPETLEALLIDHSLGELTPEAAELLQEHLALDPAAARRAQELEATLNWAREAAAVRLEPPVRPLAVARAARTPSRLAWFRVAWAEGIRLAACVVLGVAAGWWAHATRPRGTDPLAIAPVSIPQDAGRPAAAKAKNLEPAFWTVAYVLEQQRERPSSERVREDGYRIPWESLVK